LWNWRPAVSAFVDFALAFDKYSAAYLPQLEKRLGEEDGEIGFLRSETAVKNDK